MTRAAAATVYRYAKPAATGSGNCSSWANACILQTALTGAASGTEIWVAAGTYTPTTDTDRTATFQLKTGVAVYGGFAGTETARTSRNPAIKSPSSPGMLTRTTTANPVTNVSQIVGSNSYHVVTGSGTDSSAILDGFTITAGSADDSAYPNDSGGGMYNYTASPTLNNITFSGNSAYDFGGGMYDDTSSPVLTNVTFSGNSADDGGGMENDYPSSPTVNGGSFTNNTATEVGGGMFNWDI